MSETTLALVGNAAQGTVSVLALDGDALHTLASTPVGVGCGTFAWDPAAGLLHCGVKEPSPALVTLRLDRATGTLTETARRPVTHGLTYLTLTRDGILLGASYAGGWGAAWPVTDGVPGPETAHLEAANLHCVIADSAGRHAYWVSLGEDRILQTAVAPDGRVTDLAVASASAPAGAGPRHLVLGGDERSAYLVTEFTGEVIRYERDPESGLLERAESVSVIDPDAGLSVSRYGADPRAEHLIWGADVHLAGFGAYALASERTASTLAVVRLEDGLLGGVVGLVGTQAQPRGFAVAPDERHVLVVGEASGAATLYALDEDGTLTELDRTPTGEGPNWVRFA